MSEAESIFLNTFLRAAGLFGSIGLYRHISLRSIGLVIPGLIESNRSFSESLANDVENERFFVGVDGRERFFEHIGGIEGLTKMLSSQNIESYKAVVDATCLVFAHSVLDGAVLDYCRVCSLLAPCDWVHLIAGKKISVREIRDATLEEITTREVASYVDSLDRASLLHKLDRLFQVCHPPSTIGVLTKPYSYDRDRISAIDDTRHEIIHKSGPIAPIPTIEGDIEYLMDTNTFLMSIVNSKYNVRFDPALMFKKQT
ncbi:MAG: hypothetical protein ABSC04_10865 [Syntrophobacteraceae bacterium]|jgi:hypothetical protein